MSPRKKLEGLKFVGRSDYFVSGVPQTDLKVTADPQVHDEVSPEMAAELVATGLYIERAAAEGEQEEPSNG